MSCKLSSQKPIFVSKLGVLYMLSLPTCVGCSPSITRTYLRRRIYTDLYEGLVNLRFFLKQLSNGLINQLEMAAPASPPLRTLFAREPQGYGTTLVRTSVKTHVSKTKSQTEVLWILQSRWSGPHMIQLAGQKTLMDELERLVQIDPKNKDLITNCVVYCLRF